MRYEPPFPYITDYGERGHTVLAGDFVSTEDGTGVVHTGAAFGEDDFRLGDRERADDPQPGRAPTAPSTSASARSPGMHVREADPDIVEALRESGRLFRAEEYEHSYPALLALRHAAPLLREAELVRAHHRGEGRAARRERDDQLVPRAHQARPLRQLAREQRRLGAVARALLGHAAAGLALRAGPRRVRRLAARRSASTAASRRRTCTGPTSTRSCSPAPTAAARCGACPS